MSTPCGAIVEQAQQARQRSPCTCIAHRQRLLPMKRYAQNLFRGGDIQQTLALDHFILRGDVVEGGESVWLLIEHYLDAGGALRSRVYPTVL